MTLTFFFSSNYQLFKIFNELKKIANWFKAKKLSLNIRKTKYTLFHKKSSKDDPPKKAENMIGRKTPIKFLGVTLNENLFWGEHIRTVKTKLVKNIRLLYRTKALLEEKYLKSFYFPYTNSYLDYANIAWDSNYRTKLKTIHSHQKHAVHIVFNEEKLTHSHPLLHSRNALNVYQINLCQYLAFMYKFKKNKAKKLCHKYPTKFSKICTSLKAISLKSIKYYIYFCGPKIWKKF